MGRRILTGMMCTIINKDLNNLRQIYIGKLQVDNDLKIEL
jgi:hypothetical protein